MTKKLFDTYDYNTFQSGWKDEVIYTDMPQVRRGEPKNKKEKDYYQKYMDRQIQA